MKITQNHYPWCCYDGYVAGSKIVDSMHGLCFICTNLCNIMNLLLHLLRALTMPFMWNYVGTSYSKRNNMNLDHADMKDSI